MSKNPFHKFTTPAGKKVNVNLSLVQTFYEDANNNTVLTFAGAGEVTVSESAIAIRNRTKKVWPDHTTTTDVVIDNGAEG